MLITGGAGQLGRALQASAPEGLTLLCPASGELDLTEHRSVERWMEEQAPTLIINAAAYTQVDQAESEPERAFAVNETGIANLARAAGNEIPLIHVSTDFVFDGSKRAPYGPADECNPLSVYGRSKRAGEEALRRLKPESSAVVRTAWLYSARGRNFLLTMLRLMREKAALRVVDDQRGTPTHAEGLAQAIWRLAALGGTGIHHWTDDGETTWYGFARAIQEDALALGLLDRKIPLTPIPTAEYPTPARRPPYSVLDKSATSALLGIGPRPWRDELEKVLQELKEGTA